MLNKIPRHQVIYQNPYDIPHRFTFYLESNGSDETLIKWMHYQINLFLLREDKAALLELTKAILVLRITKSSQASASEETSPARNAEANGDNTVENQPNALQNQYETEG